MHLNRINIFINEIICLSRGAHMEKYAGRNLIPKEKIIYQTRRSYVIFLQPFLWLMIMCVFWFIPGVEKVSWLFFILAIATGTAALLNFYMSEMAVTNMRVLIKMGLFTVRSLETTLQNVASVEVEQGIIGRLLRYGTITILDTGKTKVVFQYIDDPFAFRKAVYMQINERYPAPETT